MTVQDKVNEILAKLSDIEELRAGMQYELGLDMDNSTVDYWFNLSSEAPSPECGAGWEEMVDAVLYIADNPPETIELIAFAGRTKPNIYYVSLRLNRTAFSFVLDNPDYNSAVETEQERFPDLIK